MMSGKEGIFIGIMLFLLGVAMALTVGILSSPEEKVTEYKVNKCVIESPAQVPDILNRCTAAVWMEENK